jgi:hypothetical protein
MRIYGLEEQVSLCFIQNASLRSAPYPNRQKLSNYCQKENLGPVNPRAAHHDFTTYSLAASAE